MNSPRPHFSDLRKNFWFDAARWFATLPVDAALNKLLERLGTLHGADRAWLAKINKDHTFAAVTHEWDAKDIPPTLGRHQEQPLAEYRWIYNKLRAGKEVHFHASEIPRRFDAFRQHLARQGVQSFYGVPIFVFKTHVALLGYHKVTGMRKWTQAERKKTRKAASLIGEWLQTSAQKTQTAAAAPEDNATLFVKSGAATVGIPFSKITCVEAALNYSQICALDRKPTVVYRGMEEWEKTLPAAQFLRVHRSYIVNLSKITRLDKNGGAWRLKLADNRLISVGRKYRIKLMGKLKPSCL